MEGRNVVTSDDHKLGTVVEERNGCAIVESGHVFKSRHAIPSEFLHEHDGVIRATVGKDVVQDSPKVAGDEFDAEAVRMHYGLVEVPSVDAGADPTLQVPSGPYPADSASFGGHPRTHDRSAEPREAS